MTNQKLKKIINNLNLRCYKKTDSATVHYYIQITGRYGVKLYRSKLACEQGFFRQKAACHLGFAPKALFAGTKSGYYYYVTQHADQTKLTYKEISEIRYLVKKMAWSTHDIYSDNIGRIKGKPVLIDFDSYTLG